MTHWPKNVGIMNMEVYFPRYFVEQSKLELFDGVSTGKYTIGLGQSKMAFCGDLEDIHSLSLTVVNNLLKKQHINPKDVGRLEVGTETIIDKSKSVKTVLMQLFEESGNTSIEGIDTTNACYGGTSAVFNAINWVESSSWDGRLAIVVTADIAVYSAGNARCTGGGGAIAMVIGPDAPLVFDRGLKATHMRHTYDFYKPDMTSEYPVIDGKLSVQSYISALESCYHLYGNKFSKRDAGCVFTMDKIDYMIFHTPYCKLVRKSIGWCMFMDYLKTKNNIHDSNIFYSEFDKHDDLALWKLFEDDSLFKQIERAAVDYSQTQFDKKTFPSTHLATNLGNMYTPSLYGSLVSLLMNVSYETLIGKRIVLFSYGSGYASSMFSMTVCPEPDLSLRFKLLLESLQNIGKRLDDRNEIEPKEFVEILKLREKSHNAKNFVPVCNPEDLFPGTFYLKNIDAQFRRFYGQRL